MVEIANNVPAGLSNSLTGSTINDYANALEWPCLGFGTKNIIIKNTDGANSLKYKVYTYAERDTGKYYEEVAETILAPDNTAQIILEYAYANVVVKVKSSVGDAHADYQIDYAGNRGGS